VRVTLDGVPETTLWTLYHRALEARRAGPEFCDPRAGELVQAIDYPFTERFGGDPVGLAQYIGLRARTFDAQVRGALAQGDDLVVVALGEGLETQFWRVDDGRVRWLTVDLPETAEVRRRLLGEDPPRRRIHAGSALDADWLDAVRDGPGDRVLVVAQGLLMYLPPPGVRALIVRCARRFRGGALVFDTVPRWFSALSMSGAMRSPTGYTAPPMPWGLDGGDHRPISALHPDIVAVRTVPPPPGRGPLFGALMPLGARLPVLRAWQPSVVRVDFR
jgi:O-methyltransferase involved in polyketide biosynthesis